MASFPGTVRDVKEWRRTIQGHDYLISTSRTLISAAFVNKAFASADMRWAKELSANDLQTLLSQSLTLGVYLLSPAVPSPADPLEPSSPRTPSPTLDKTEDVEMVGMARFVTDYVTQLYLTDVYIQPQQRNRGLSSWLIKCCRNVIDDMPHLRRLLLVTSPDKEKFYGRELDCRLVNDESGLVCMTRKLFKTPEEAGT